MGLAIANLREPERKNYSIDEWYSCVRKQQLTKDKAVGTRRHLNRVYQGFNFTFTEYLCEHCGHWHVGREMILTKTRRKRLTRDATSALADAIEMFLA